MERDGELISLWQHNIPNYSPHNQFIPGQLVDVIIIGGGITGATTALTLQKAGKKCLLLEARNIGFGTTGGTTCHLNTIMDTPYYQIANNFGEESAQQVAGLARNAIELIERNILEHTIECSFSKKSAYIFSQDEPQVNELEKIVESSKRVLVDIAYVDSIPVDIPFITAAEVKGQAQMHSTQYLYGVVQAFEKAGGFVLQNCRVTDVTQADGANLVQTTLGQMQATHVVYATHIPPGVNILHFRCAPYRSYAMAVKLKNDFYPDALVYDLYDPYYYYRTQQVNGSTYLIAGGEDHKTAHEENTTQRFKKLEAHVRKYFEVDSVDFCWSSQYFEPADGLPYIGHLPGNPPNVWVATGFGGNGIIYGTASALILADLICNGSSEYQQLFNPARVKPVAGFQNFVKEAADVVGVFVGKAFATDEIDNLVQLAKGDARVVKYDGQTIALYKDEAGKLHGVNPSCPHIKCTVSWNTAEKSWDCPCHGSRFSYTGQLLTGPARKDLENIKIQDNIR